MAQNIYCISCDSYTSRENLYGLCHSCIEKISWITGPVCEICGKPLRLNYSKSKCPICEEGRRYFKKGYVTVEYGLLERMLISKFKKGENRSLARNISQMMADKIDREIIEFDVISSVPIHKNRMKKRGFNQSELLGRYISKLSEKPYWDYLYRKYDTIHMKNLDKFAREINIDGAFGVKERFIKNVNLQGKSVLLIDDILTTGATVNQCSKVLLQGGAKEVKIMVFAG